MSATYLCGGIHGLPDETCKDWRAHAADRLVTRVRDPLSRDYRGREDANVAEIVTGDLADLTECGYVLVNAVMPSWGTAMEVFAAAQAGDKFIVAFTPAKHISPWLQHHCHKIVGTLDEAVHAINRRALLITQPSGKPERS